MASFAKVYLLILVMFSDGFFASGEMFQFFLDILDMMDPSWIYSTYDSIRSKIECASLCYRDEGSCSYFGYKGSTCYLLKDSVDRDICSQDDCSNTGMKVYKWKQEITSTEQTVKETSTINSSTTSEITTSTTHDATTTTTPATTTTTSREETTSTTTPTTTVTETTTSIDDATTTTEGSTTTTTTEGTTTTTTTEGTATTTTTDGTTTSIEDTTEGSTSSTTEETTTETEDPTTTTESTTTTTTETPTTTTTESTTTTEATSTTTEGWNCDPPDGLEGEVTCPKGTDLLRAMGTRSKFLVDVFSGTCTPMMEQVFVDEEEVHTFFTLDGGITLNSKCPHIHHVIYKFKLCVKKDHPAAITLHCRYLKDPDKIEERFNETNNDLDNLVNCGDNSAIQSISFGPHSFNDKLTMIYFSCVRVEVEEVVPSVDSPDPGVG